MEAEYMPAFEILGNTFRALPTQSYTIDEIDMAKGAKLTKPRAPRIPVETWEKMRPTICEEYMTKTLEELVTFLKVEHDFSVKKRQLVYRLGIWDCAKYNGAKGLKDEQSNVDSDLDDEELGTDDGHFNEVTDALGLTPCFEAGSYAYDIITHNIQAANAIFAVAGGTYAWETYNADFRDDMEDSKRLVALCRSAETVEQCREALKLLEFRISKSNSHVGFWSLLYVYVVESMNHEIRDNDHCRLEDPIKQMLSAAVSSILLGSWQGFLLKEGGSVDLFAFHLLDTVYEQQHTLSLQLEEKRLGSLLDNLDSWVLSAYDGGEKFSALRTVRQCARWCFLSLNEVSRDANQTRLQIRSAHNEDEKDWKTHLEIYGTLWHKLFMQQLNLQGLGFDAGAEADGGTLAWAQNSRRDLGISHAEVLSCMCWIIANHGSVRDHDDGDGDGTQESLFGRARAAAHGVWNTGPRELWIEFLHTFKRFNDLTATEEPEYERSRNAFMKEFVAFVDGTLEGFATFGSSKMEERIGSEFYPAIAYQERVADMLAGSLDDQV
ncbi:hypothetical protein CSIM01_09938 [Colletotrichum simmondsii]|uniref:Clr5 domain-containing protein n=1 Tax=Colletotrichum simmondsii TaxID=703756 RepID=A0A135SVZ0_9PEZI|nr:hypothetical protein CSIM01_09938 [Colletotrichum simmondsii]